MNFVWILSCKRQTSNNSFFTIDLIWIHFCKFFVKIKDRYTTYQTQSNNYKLQGCKYYNLHFCYLLKQQQDWPQITFWPDYYGVNNCTNVLGSKWWSFSGFGFLKKVSKYLYGWRFYCVACDMIRHIHTCFQKLFLVPLLTTNTQQWSAKESLF